MRDRNWRRAQRDRAIARVDRDHIHLNSKFLQVSSEDRRAMLCRAAITPHPCSRYCCGNPRRHFDGDSRLSRQELKWLLSSSEQELDFWEEWFRSKNNK